MENSDTLEHGGCLLAGGDDHGHHLELPPGFRFHPTDEELITHYLCRKAADRGFIARAIGEIDLNKIEPWDLPRKAKMGEKEWYFFAVRDRKYPTGLRTNRATDAGYWKATGKDKEIHRGSNLVGMKKTLVFYRGRAPKGEKTDWVMHEYRLDGKLSLCNLPKTARNEWVICRVFQKSFSAAGDDGGSGGGGKKVAGLVRMGSSSYGDEIVRMAGIAGNPVLTPPVLMDTAQLGGGTGSKMVGASPAASSAAHVTCFSNPMEGHMGYFASDPLFSSSAININPPSEISSWPLLSNTSVPDGDLMSCLRLSGRGLVQLLQSHGSGGEEVGGSLSQETGLTSDMNPEISSSLLCKRPVHKLCFDGLDVSPSAPPGNNRYPTLGDCFWNHKRTW